MSEWITPPGPPVLISRAQPYLVVPEMLGEFDHQVAERAAKRVEVDLASASAASDVISRLKEVLPFPEWCASSWDSIEDAFEEIREEWPFPLAVVVNGVDSLVARKPHLALETVLRVSELSHAFSVAGDQLLVVYVWRADSSPTG